MPGSISSVISTVFLAPNSVAKVFIISSSENPLFFNTEAIVSSDTPLALPSFTISLILSALSLNIDVLVPSPPLPSIDISDSLISSPLATFSDNVFNRLITLLSVLPIIFPASKPNSLAIFSMNLTIAFFAGTGNFS